MGLIAVLIAGFVSVALHQPCADSLAVKLDGSSAAGTEDSICLVVFFLLFHIYFEICHPIDNALAGDFDP